MDNAAHCPGCGAALPPGGACPRCAITTAEPPPAPSTHIAAGEPVPPAPFPLMEAPLSPAWLKVQNALTVLHRGLVISLVGSVAVAIALAIPLLQQASGPSWAPQPSTPCAVLVLLAGGALAILAGWVVALVGESAAGRTPPLSGARGWAHRAFEFAVAGKGLALLGVVLVVHAALWPVIRADDFAAAEVMGESRPFLWIAVLGSALASAAEVVCVALYLRAVARFFGANLLTRRAGEYARFFVTFSAVLLALNLLSSYLLRVIPGDPDTKARMLPILTVMEMGCYLIVMAQLLGLVLETRDTVARARTGASGPAADATPSGR